MLADRYRLDEVLLDDGSGRLHRGWDTRLEREVSVKVLQPELASSVRGQRHFEREARILGGLSHQGLLPLYEVRLEADPPFMVLGPVHGRSLASWVSERGPLHWTMVVAWMRDLLKTLSVAHGRGFAHRDVCPEVVFIDDQTSGAEGRALLVGLGRLRVIGHRKSTSLEGRPNVPLYWAPEMFLGDDIDPRSDLRGVAAVAYFALTGQPPLPIDPRMGVGAALQRLMSDVPRPVSDLVSSVPPELETTIARALAIRPDERHQTTYEMLQALDMLEGETLPLERATEPSPLGIGEVVDGSYEIVSRLGRGGMSRVFLAHDLQLDRDVALKCLDSSSPVAHEQLLNEVQALERIRHPNVVGVFGYGSCRGTPYLVLEHVPGPSARTLLRRQGGLSTAEAVSIVDQAARGLDAVHREGLVHGDVKPQNVLIGPAFQVRLLDFGLVAERRDVGPKANRFAGTPAYAAPERIRGELEPDLAPRSDVYSLGVMAYELLTGKRPFVQGDLDQLLAAHLWSTPPPMPEHEALGAVVQRALAKDPTERFATPELFRRALVDAFASKKDPRPFRCLVIDENEGYARFVEDALTTGFPGCEVVIARSGTEGIDAMTNKLDIVLMELRMKDANGLEIAAHARASLASPPPIACVSAAIGDADVPLLAALGVRGVLPKPVTASDLVLLVSRLVKR